MSDEKVTKENKGGEKKFFKKNKRRSRRPERAKSEFDQKILNIRRVTRVSAGGRRFSFSVAMAIGNRKGKVGVGIGKAGDTSLAIEKAAKNAKKNLIEVKRTKDNSIAHDIKAKYNSARVMIMPAKGRGMIAGSALRDILELAGISDINAKIVSGSKNKINIARAAIKALKTLKN
jgi:small subunit ribosomal protein S5